VEAVIRYKPAARDPEAEVIRRDLLLKGGYGMIKDVRSGKSLRMIVEASSPEEAKQIVERACNELRIFNPVAHTLEVRVWEKSA